MRIANPIYDVVFKYLMRNNEIAILILSTILDEEIMALDFLPQETYVALENRSFTVYRLDFSARIKARDGTIKHVIIEIQEGQVRRRHHALSPLSWETIQARIRVRRRK